MSKPRTRLFQVVAIYNRNAHLQIAEVLTLRQVLEYFELTPSARRSVDRQARNLIINMESAGGWMLQGVHIQETSQSVYDWSDEPS